MLPTSPLESRYDALNFDFNRWKCECATNQCTRIDAAGEVLHDVQVYYEFRAQMESGSAEDMPEAAAKIAEMYGQNQASRGEELDTQTDGDAASGSAASALNCNQEDRSGCGDWSKKGCVLQSWDELQVMQDIQANFASALSNQSQQLNVCQDPSFYWWPRKLTFNPDKAVNPVLFILQESDGAHFLCACRMHPSLFHGRMQWASMTRLTWTMFSLFLCRFPLRAKFSQCASLLTKLCPGTVWRRCRT